MLSYSIKPYALSFNLIQAYPVIAVLDLIQIGYTVLPEDFDPLIITDVTIDRFIAVFGFDGNFRGKIAIHLQGDNFPFMGNGTGKGMNNSPCRKQSFFALNLTHILTDHSITDP